MSDTDFPDSFLIFGCGNMGGAILRGWIAAGISPERFTVIDPYAQNLPAGVRHFAEAKQVDTQFGSALLSIKPQMLGKLSHELTPLLAPGAQLISILAGATCAAIAAKFPGAKIIRLMPNLAAEIGKSPLGLWSIDLNDTEKSALDRTLSALGPVFWLASEDLMDAFTALAGSGPAYLYRFIDTMAAAGAALGLDADQANQMALAMTEGAAILAVRNSSLNNDSPGDLAARVASAGGSTAAGLSVLDESAALQKLMAATLAAAARRNAELAIIAEQTSND